MWLVGIIILILILAIMHSADKSEEQKRQREEMERIFKEADVLSRKIRYEKKSFSTRIAQVVDQNFDDYKVINNLILMDEDGVEHQIPMLCATNKGVILFQTVDYPGKGLFGSSDGEWQIAQSASIAQVVPNAAALAIENAMLIKRLTNIDVKPIAVISKYTPAAVSVLAYDMGERVFTEDELKSELDEIARYGNQTYPAEFMQQVKEKLLRLHVEDEDDDEDEFEPAVDC